MVTPLVALEDLVEEGRQVFEKEFKMIPEIVAMSHAALNIIGEHTEYNEGYVFPMTIPMMTVIVGRKNLSRTIRLFTTANVDQPHLAEFFAPLNTKPLERGTPLWANYLKGVIQHFDGPLMGFDAVIISNIPMGRGLSSSASLEIAAYTFLETLTGVQSDLQKKAELCHRAEFVFARHDSSFSDQLGSTFSQDGHGVLIDCRTFEVRNIPIHLGSATFLVIDVNHTAAFPANFVNKSKLILDQMTKMCGKDSLRDVTISDLDHLNSTGCIDQCMYLKARFIIEENERVLKACRSISDNSYKDLGCLLNESHDKLRSEYNVSMSPETEKLMGIIRGIDGVHGAKGIGGGYSGCILALIESSAMDDIIKKIKYKFPGDLRFYNVTPAGGPQSMILDNKNSSNH